jgi:L-ribulose-5-phosphate 4-epimerase
MKIHAVLYKAWPTVRGVVHTHSPFTTGWAQACESVPLMGTPRTRITRCMTYPVLPYLTEKAVWGDDEAKICGSIPPK